MKKSLLLKIRKLMGPAGVLLGLSIGVLSCAPHFAPPLPVAGGEAPQILAPESSGADPAEPGLQSEPQTQPERIRFRMADGTVLAGRHWAPAGEAGAGGGKGVVIGLHGMGDYSNAFAGIGAYLAAEGFRVYAYDQRGFGETPRWGHWAGEAALAGDLRSVAALLRARHPEAPIGVLGLSMGASVALAAFGTGAESPVGTLVLAAPATWGWSTLPFHYRAALWLGARLFPSRSFTGKGLDIWPSDNIEMLRAYARDPLVVKGTRTDAIYGLVDLMDTALQVAPRVRAPVLVVYGAKDQIVPEKPVAALLKALPGPKRYALYPEGYHMLLRDLGREAVWRDIAAYFADRGAPLPSGAETALPGGKKRAPALARLRRD